MHHRIKNNMAALASVMSIHAADTEDEKVRAESEQLRSAAE